LVSLFIPEALNKTHDGAVLIRNLKIARAGVFFPMPETKILDASLGSRHRAALGITEETDAVVVVVSEERGTISFCFSGNIVQNLDGQSLRHALLGLFGRSSRKRRFARRSPSRPTSPVPAPRATVTPASAHDQVAPAKPAAATRPPDKPAPPSKTATPLPKIPTSTPMRPSTTPAQDERPSIDRGRVALTDVPAGTTPRPASAAEGAKDKDKDKEDGDGARAPGRDSPTTQRTFVPTTPSAAPEVKETAEDS
jgi:diadenylate cyclase